MSKQHSPLRFNVGFIIHETLGYTRDFDFQFPFLDFADDLTAKDLKGTATITRTQQGILLEAQVTATLATECARCLDASLTEVHSDFTELYAFDERSETESGLIVPEDGYLDLKPLVRDYIMLDIPLAPLCKPNCAGLCPVCGINLNKETCDCEQESIDPRLAKLKDLLDE